MDDKYLKYFLFVKYFSKLYFGLVLPLALHLGLSLAEGWKSFGTLERNQLTKLYYFMLFNVFLITALSASIMDQLNDVINDPSSIVDSLAIGLPAVCILPCKNSIVLLGARMCIGICINTESGLAGL